MRIALLIGVSQYQSSEKNLPACDLDLDLMQELLEKTGEYEDIFRLSGNSMSAVELKNLVAEWVKKYANREIDEIFFYYTGHGQFYDDEFYFQLYDFNLSKRQQTSLTNSELDSWLRSLSPELTLKVIDACNSGIPYIKGGNDALAKYLGGTKTGFKKCIFMFSSTVEQSSWQDAHLSAFTKVFVDAVRGFEAETIRYRDIMDFISDEFASNSNWPSQTPVFVTQVYNVEIFCHLTSDIRQIVYPNYPIAQLPESSDTSPKLYGLKDLVQKEAESYVSKEEAVATLTELQARFEKYSYSREISELYEIEQATLNSLQSIPYIRAIGQWLLENEHDFFAEPAYRTVYDYTPRGEIARAMGESGSRRELEGFDLTFDTPFKAFRIVARRKFPNIPAYYCAITFLVAKSKIRFFYVYTSYRDKNWDEIVLNTDVKWQSAESRFGNTTIIVDTLSEIQAGFERHIIRELRTKYGLEDEIDMS